MTMFLKHKNPLRPCKETNTVISVFTYPTIFGCTTKRHHSSCDLAANSTKDSNCWEFLPPTKE